MATSNSSPVTSLDANPVTNIVAGNLPTTAIAATVAAEVIVAEIPVAVSPAPVKIVFKNLNQAPTVTAPTLEAQQAPKPAN